MSNSYLELYTPIDHYFDRLEDVLDSIKYHLDLLWRSDLRWFVNPDHMNLAEFSWERSLIERHIKDNVRPQKTRIKNAIIERISERYLECQEERLKVWKYIRKHGVPENVNEEEVKKNLLIYEDCLLSFKSFCKKEGLDIEEK